MNANQFQDRAGRLWTVDLTMRDAKALRAKGIEIDKFLDDDMAHLKAVIGGDDDRLSGAVFSLCQSQHQGVTLDEFDAAIGGDELDGIRDAFYEAFVLFCPSRMRPALRELKSSKPDDSDASDPSKPDSDLPELSASTPDRSA